MNPSAEYNFKPKDFFILTDVGKTVSTSNIRR